MYGWMIMIVCMYDDDKKNNVCMYVCMYVCLYDDDNDHEAEVKYWKYLIYKVTFGTFSFRHIDTEDTLNN